MIEHPTDFLDYQICGFKTIIIHYEAYKNEFDLHESIKTIKSIGLEPAICIKNETSVDVLKNFAKRRKAFSVNECKSRLSGNAFFGKYL